MIYNIKRKTNNLEVLMKAGIIGAGAMGSIFAYFFKKADIDTVIYEKNQNIVAEAKSGLTIHINGKSERIRIVIGSDPDVLRGSDIILIFVKSHATDTAIKKIKEIISSDTILVSLQNGLGNKEKIAEHINSENIVFGSTSIGAYKSGRTDITLGGLGDSIIGGVNKQAVQRVEDLFKKAGLIVRMTDDPDKAVWKKAIINAAINPFGAILGIENGRIIENEFTLSMQKEIIREAVEIALSLGIKFDIKEMADTVIDVCKKTAKNRCSMLQDIESKRKTEIDSINGMIVNYGRQSRIKTPYNDSLYNLIKAKEKYCMPLSVMFVKLTSII